MAKMITSVQHPLVKHLVRLRQNRDYREEHQSVMIEGTKLIEEICSQHQTKFILTCAESAIPSKVRCEEVIIVNEAVMKKVSGVQSSEGIIAEVSMPKPASLKKVHWLLACDGVSDPGNLGTLLRSGLALGWEAIFILENSCDPYNDKALRAAKGATFRLPIAFGNWSDLRDIVHRNELNPLVAHMQGTSIDKINKKIGTMLVLSNEAQGISREAQQHCQKVSIPMHGQMESLNVGVAGGILMYALRNI